MLRWYPGNENQEQNISNALEDHGLLESLGIIFSDAETDAGCTIWGVIAGCGADGIDFPSDGGFNLPFPWSN